MYKIFNIFNTLISKLYPTGRAWNYGRNNTTKVEAEVIWVSNETQDYFTDGEDVVFGLGYDIFEKTSKRLKDVDCQILTDYVNMSDEIFYQLLADNENFTAEDCDTWERTYGLNNSDLDLESRKSIILARQTNKSSSKYTNTASYLQNVLRGAGFALTVHENRLWSGTEHTSINPVGAYYGAVYYGEFYYGDQGISYDSICCNYIEKQYEKPIFLDEYNNKAYCFVIGSDTLGTFAVIPKEKESQLRQLILQTKSLHLVALLQIQFI